MKLLNSFYLVEPLPRDKQLGVVKFSCTCHGKLGIAHPYGFQCTRKCKHVLAHGIHTHLYYLFPT